MPVTVLRDQTVPFDTIVDQPGFVTGIVQISGGTIASASIAVERADESALSLTQTSADRSFRFQVPVVPGSGLRVRTTVLLTNGTEISLPLRTVNVAPGATVDLELSGVAPPQGAVTATLGFGGESRVDRYQLQMSGPTAISRTIVPADGFSATQREEGLAVGSYTITLKSFHGNGDDEVTLPAALILPRATFILTVGAEHVVSAVFSQAQMVGALDIGGALDPIDVESGQVVFRGLANTSAAGGVSSDRISVPALRFDALLTPGSWYTDSLRLQLSRPLARGFLRQSLFLRDERTKSSPLVVVAGETVSQDLGYRFSRRTFQFVAPNGSTLSSPRVTANCTRHDANGVLLWSFTAISSTDVQLVTDTTVELFAPDGVCSYLSEARINGANAHMGSGSVEFVAGSEGEVDTGAPSLKGISVLPGICIGDDSIVVSGIASDDTFVASVNANGMPASLQSTESITDPAEVRFDALVPLVVGQNQIVTVATDSVGKSTSDTRTITRSLDSDGDTFLDCRDGCVADGEKTAPGACGCGVPDRDSDGDFALDCHDLCPTDANKTQPLVCGCGVSEVDSDTDGALDCIDLCPIDSSKQSPGICGCGERDDDVDGDMAFDCFDGCPADPGKISAGVCGCGVSDVDSDADGLADCVDECPTDALKSSAGLCGCGSSESDSDGDGAVDCVDLCPADSGKQSPGVCGCGASDLDSDGDGIADCSDGCPLDRSKVLAGVCGCGLPDSDVDGDGIYACEGDCNDLDARFHPGAIEVCGDPDLNCDGRSQEMGSLAVTIEDDIIGLRRWLKPVTAKFDVYAAEKGSCLREMCGRGSQHNQLRCLRKHCVPDAILVSSAGVASAELPSGAYVVFAQDSPVQAQSEIVDLECGSIEAAEYHRIQLVTPRSTTTVLDWFEPQRRRRHHHHHR